MPDHFHGIVGLGGGSGHRADGLDAGSRAHAVRPYLDRGPAVRPYLDRGPAVRPYLGQFVAGFKSACTRRYREIAADPAGALWQRGYYEHVIRGHRALLAIRRYIADNPRRW
ncbi:MAG: hypothetical protein ACREMZ_08220 [Gemmatimonadales bacterium]